MEDVLVDSISILNKCTDEDQREDIKIIIFSNILVKPFGDMTRYIRKINEVVVSEHCNEFIEEQRTVTETTIDKIENSSEKTVLNVIKNDIRRNDDISDNLNRALEKAETKNKQKMARNEPIKILEKVNLQLSSIDTQIFGKLDARNLKLIFLEVEKPNILKNKTEEELKEYQ